MNLEHILYREGIFYESEIYYMGKMSQIQGYLVNTQMYKTPYTTTSVAVGK